MAKNVLIIGAGASGMMAAAAAARNGAQVTVLEAQERPGRKLLATGNGRCNLTNMDAELPEKYYGSGAFLAGQIIRRFDAGAVRGFFASLGLLTTEKNGYVYPYSQQASSVLEVLLCEMRRLGIKLKLNEKIIHMEHSGGEWLAQTDTWTYRAQAVIVSCGSKAAVPAQTGGTGCHLAAELGHTVIPQVPALVPVVCEHSFPAQLAGVRCRAEVALSEHSDGKRTVLARDLGELQWTKYGVSGIVVFQLSRFISSYTGSRKKLRLHIDLLPDFTEEELLECWMSRSKELGREPAASLFAGVLHEKIAAAVLSRCRIPGKLTCRELSEEQLCLILRQMKDFELSVSGTKSFDTCQVCAGGIDCREVSELTLESKIHKGLYFTGEVLDVDGPCGGYNLQWAWSSGYAAGTAAARCHDAKP